MSRFFSLVKVVGLILWAPAWARARGRGVTFCKATCMCPYLCAQPSSVINWEITAVACSDRNSELSERCLCSMSG